MAFYDGVSFSTPSEEKSNTSHETTPEKQTKQSVSLKSRIQSNLRKSFTRKGKNAPQITPTSVEKAPALSYEEITDALFDLRTQVEILRMRSLVFVGSNEERKQLKSQARSFMKRLEDIGKPRESSKQKKEWKLLNAGLRDVLKILKNRKKLLSKQYSAVTPTLVTKSIVENRRYSFMSPVEKLNDIDERLKHLEERVNLFSGSVRHPEYSDICDRLTRLFSDLDMIDFSCTLNNAERDDIINRKMLTCEGIVQIQTGLEKKATEYSGPENWKLKSSATAATFSNRGDNVQLQY